MGKANWDWPAAQRATRPLHCAGMTGQGATEPAAAVEEEPATEAATSADSPVAEVDEGGDACACACALAGGGGGEAPDPHE